MGNKQSQKGENKTNVDKDDENFRRFLRDKQKR